MLFGCIKNKLYGEWNGSTMVNSVPLPGTIDASYYLDSYDEEEILGNIPDPENNEMTTTSDSPVPACYHIFVESRVITLQNIFQILSFILKSELKNWYLRKRSDNNS
jgi:hypothetical protein